MRTLATSGNHSRPNTNSHNPQNWIAYVTLFLAGLGIATLGAISIKNDSSNSMTIFNMVLPVFSSWVGTILAFYFGSKNFDAASSQVSEANRRLQEVVGTLSPEQKGSQPVAAVMKRVDDITVFLIHSASEANTVKISEIKDKLQGSISRILIIDPNHVVQYLIHASRIDAYLSTQGNVADSLESFFGYYQRQEIGFGLEQGFVVVSENTPVNLAKKHMEDTHGCQDIVVTRNGSPQEPLTGWLSNTRLSRYIVSS